MFAEIATGTDRNDQPSPSPSEVLNQLPATGPPRRQAQQLASRLKFSPPVPDHHTRLLNHLRCITDEEAEDTVFKLLQFISITSTIPGLMHEKIACWHHKKSVLDPAWPATCSSITAIGHSNNGGLRYTKGGKLAMICSCEPYVSASVDDMETPSRP